MKRKLGTIGVLLATLFAAAALLQGAIVSAQQPAPGPSDEAFGVEGRIPSPPPTQAATIVSPANGQAFSSLPITVTGSCPAGTLVKLFSNNIFVGSTTCEGGSYTLQISLFSGQNDLVAKVFDALDQPGPDSRTITVTYSDPQFAQFGSQVLLTSQYARRAADPNVSLEWPFILSSGLGPYAFSIDWGDDTPVELRSEQFAGIINLRHSYKSPGVYRVIVRVADKNGSSAFLQVIAIANGQPGDSTASTGQGNDDKTVVTERKILWQPAAALLLIAPLSFWLGRRAELSALRKRLDREYR